MHAYLETYREVPVVNLTVWCFFSGGAGAVATLLHDGFMNPIDGRS